MKDLMLLVPAAAFRVARRWWFHTATGFLPATISARHFDAGCLSVPRSPSLQPI